MPSPLKDVNETSQSTGIAGAIKSLEDDKYFIGISRRSKKDRASGYWLLPCVLSHNTSPSSKRKKSDPLSDP
jgi:hypothetical protein